MTWTSPGRCDEVQKDQGNNGALRDVMRLWKNENILKEKIEFLTANE